MFKNRLILTLLIAVGGVFLLIVSLRQELEKNFDIPDWFINLLMALGLILVILEVVNIVNELIIDNKLKSETFNTRNVTEEEIDWMLDYAKGILPTLVPSKEKALNWHRRFPKAYYIVTRSVMYRRKHTIHIVEAFVITPITNEAKIQLENNRLIGGNLKESDILNTGNSTNFYIGSIVSEGYRNKAETLISISGYINAKISNSSSPVTFFTNPATKDGLRIAKKYGFEPVDPSATFGQSIYKKEFNV